jgi:hypothetical protein
MSYKVKGFNSVNDVYSQYQSIFDKIGTANVPSAVNPPQPTFKVGDMKSREESPDELRKDVVKQQQIFRQNLASIVNDNDISTLIAKYSPEKIVQINENMVAIKKQLTGRSNMGEKYFDRFVSDFLTAVSKPITTQPE